MSTKNKNHLFGGGKGWGKNEKKKDLPDILCSKKKLLFKSQKNAQGPT